MRFYSHMDSSASHRRRLINNELLIRRTNKKIKKVIREHTPEEEHESLLINFYCECSALDCEERISLTIDAYEKLHLDDSKFVLAPGHEAATVEKTIFTTPQFIIVEKFALQTN